MLAVAKAAVSIDVGDYSLVASEAGLGGYQAFPDICRLQDGRLMTVFYDGYTHISTPNATYPNGGRISYVTSTDEGETWSPLGVLYDTPDDDRDPSIAQLPDGRLLCTFFRLGSGVSLVRSDDGGNTWSAPQILTDSYYTSAPIRRMSDGKLVLGLYYEPGDGTAHGAVMTSNDNGDTWTTPIDIPNPSGAYLDAETDVIELNDGGGIWAVQRSSHSPAQYSISTNGAATWSNSQPLDFVAHCPYLHRTEHDGMILMGYRGYYSLDGWGPGFTGLRYSLDECQTWSDPILVDDVIGAYPSMVNLDDGSVFVTYYEEGGDSNIRGRRLVISDGTQQGPELVYEDFEGVAPGTLLNTMPGWSGADDFVISATTIDQGQSLDASTGSTGWPKITKGFSHTPSAEDSYEFSGTLWIGSTSGDYAHAQLGVAGSAARLWVGLGFDELIYGYDDENGASVGAAVGEYAVDTQLRMPLTVNEEDGSVATMDFKLLISGDSMEGYWRLNGDTEWVNAGQITGGLDFADFTQVDLNGHGGYEGRIDSVRLVVTTSPALTPGDANGDGYVDVTDLGILATHYGDGSGKTWAEGDFTIDGVVDVSDLGILATNYGMTQPASVPEPGILTLLAIASLALLARRRR